MIKIEQGMRFGRLVVVADTAERRNGGKRIFLCSCDCGQSTRVMSSLLNAGKTRSCGCLREELRSTRPTTHGMTDSTEYTSWMDMKARCKNRNGNRWHVYGARGISVCERWLSFENFLADMGLKPTPQHSIDRIDNDLGYEPGNCRWATPREQALNRRKKAA